MIVIGSAQKSHEARNPFTAGERIVMIKQTLDNEKGIDIRRILIIPVPDVDVHSLWTSQVDMLVPKYDLVIANDPFTLMLFRERGIKVVRAPLYRRRDISGTSIRMMMESGDPKWAGLVPRPVARIVKVVGGIARVKAIAEKRAHIHHTSEKRYF